MKFVVLFMAATAIATTPACNDHCDKVKKVCGRTVDGPNISYRTFPNECELEKANCYGQGPYTVVGPMGESCADQDRRNKCESNCTAEIDPYCGARIQNGHRYEKTFLNYCLMSNTNCMESNNPYVMVKHGEC